MITTVIAIVFGSLLGLQLHLLFKSVTQHMNAKQLARLRKLVHALSAVAVVEAALLHSIEIARFVAVALSDYLGIWIIKYCGESLHFLAGKLGEGAKALYDYAALAHPVDPMLQAVAICLLAQMLVIEVLSREKK